ncbi:MULTISPECIES: hypothetical protein [Lysobacter]|uniref:Uncharacterized protein n=1 Tax=Lysobacter yananisis TaxID=1003114 RepID=A0ABY9PBY6_9GAMM|nr:MULTISPECIES: hypothetical protein [Lysobacter]QQQ01221.1 hypothetical protein JHW41_24760 [Lysobacter enzymogenes]UZW60497.1 hypothetical protein BV903_025110 [Lysobacter enzymogenes]WMT04379.1 hypothetical protein RDV84_05960 [Lysobacter yananisis]
MTTTDDTTASAAPAASPAAPPAGWWRRNAGWLAGTAVLGALALWLPYRDALRQYRLLNPSIAVAANKHDWTAFAGARWKLVAAESVPARDPRLRGPLRKDAEVVLLRYEVIPDSGTKTVDLDGCRGAIVDAQGRRWDTGGAALPRLSGPRLPETCGSGYDDAFKQVLAVPGRPFAFQHAFVLPRGQRLEDLRARIEMKRSETVGGRYLEFAL